MTDQYKVHVVNMRPVHFLILNLASNTCVAVAVTITALMLDSSWALLALVFMRRPDAGIVWKRG